MDKFKKPILTEKSISLLEKRQYTFELDLNITKSEAKKWIERHFEVKVIGINSYCLPIKKRVKTHIGKRKRKKRMIFTLKVGNSIPFSSIN
uniref:Large ribosomal subunit protein uL23c n=1 Tax=Nitellopsis obtusa TaxID=40811 RepID=A0A8F6U4U2_9VIRI|nr:ribosomal protein L23 [Nitellopsis obtusa]